MSQNFTKFTGKHSHRSLFSNKVPIVCTPPPTKFSKSGGLTGLPLLEGGYWERGGDIFQAGGYTFHIKNKLKSEVFNDKKFISKNIFLCHN